MTTVGCGEQLATVSGTITLDGQPIAAGGDVRGIVTFNRADGHGTPSSGVLDSLGRYRLSTAAGDKIEPGEYLVAVSATKIIIPEPGATPSGRPITPRRYASAKNSGLTADVKAGQNTIDFHLKAETDR
jgi:hypothetical protein